MFFPTYGLWVPAIKNTRTYAGAIVTSHTVFLFFRRMVRSLSLLSAASPLLEIICVGDLDDIMNMNRYPSPYVSRLVQKILEEGRGKELGNFPHLLNEEQLAQIRRALENPFTLIQGPPGTLSIGLPYF